MKKKSNVLAAVICALFILASAFAVGASYGAFELLPNPSETAEPTPTPTFAPPTAPTEEPTVEPTVEPTPDPAIASAQELLGTMTPDEKLWQLFILTPEQLTGYERVYAAGNATKTFLEQKPVGGLIYFAQNLENTAQTTLMLSNTQSYTKLPLILGIQEEGGEATVVGGKSEFGTDAFPAASTLGNVQSAGEVGEKIRAGVAEVVVDGWEAK